MPLPNPSMSFSPFAILTAEELNDLVANIESLADGSGLDDGSVIADKLADESVTAEKLAAGAVFLGYTELSTSFSSSNTSVTDITGAAVTVNVPDTSRKVKITALAPQVECAGATFVNLLIREDSTTLSASRERFASADQRVIQNFVVLSGVTPGEHTYKLSFSQSGGSTTVIFGGAGDGFRTRILVELI